MTVVYFQYTRVWGRDLAWGLNSAGVVVSKANIAQRVNEFLMQVNKQVEEQMAQSPTR